MIEGATCTVYPASEAFINVRFVTRPHFHSGGYQPRRQRGRGCRGKRGERRYDEEEGVPGAILQYDGRERENIYSLITRLILLKKEWSGNLHDLHYVSESESVPTSWALKATRVDTHIALSET